MGSSERWIIVKPDGTLILHSENDGVRYLRKGAEAVDEEVTLEYLKQHHPGLYEDARKELERRGEEAALRDEVDDVLFDDAKGG
jgi:hypothetical protein